MYPIVPQKSFRCIFPADFAYPLGLGVKAPDDAEYVRSIWPYLYDRIFPPEHFPE